LVAIGVHVGQVGVGIGRQMDRGDLRAHLGRADGAGRA
jgi:hypothetical protein